MKFEWDEEKYFENLIKHGIRFEDAQNAFADEYAIETLDLVSDPNEERIVLLGLAISGILVIVYCERAGDVVRIISARKANRYEKDVYERRIRF